MAESIGEAAERSGSTPRAGDAAAGFERGGTILAELAEATRLAAEALVEEQKQRAAAQAKGIAEAVRLAADRLERSETPGIGRYADQAAGQIEQLSQLIGERNWSEIIAETRDFARRRPMLFLVAAAAAGFLAGRVLSVPTVRRRQETLPPAELSPHRGETDPITAAVSSGDNGFAGPEIQ